MTHQTETAELIQAAAKLDPSAWLSAEGTPVRLHPDAAAALGGLLVAIANTDDETLNKASLVRSAALTAARVVAASNLAAACAHCGSSDHTWDDCEAYTRLVADAYARTLNTPPSAETCAAIRDRLHSGSEPAAVSAAVAPPTDQTALRDRIAEALLDHLSRTADIRTSSSGGELAFMPEVTDAERMRMADAVLAVLPAPADRAAVLREAADRVDNEELPHDYVDMFDNGARWAARLLRRMADETATEPPQPSLRERHRAAWHALTPDQQTARLAELDEPAAGARQDEPRPSTPPCAHCAHPKSDHDGRADHRAKHSPLVAGEPWCHACNAQCDYATAERQDGAQQ